MLLHYQRTPEVIFGPGVLYNCHSNDGTVPVRAATESKR